MIIQRRGIRISQNATCRYSATFNPQYDLFNLLSKLFVRKVEYKYMKRRIGELNRIDYIGDHLAKAQFANRVEEISRIDLFGQSQSNVKKSHE